MSTSLVEVKSYIEKEDVKKRFNDILGKKASQFMASVVNTVANSKSLMNVESSSIMNSAFIAASLDLPIDPNLGFAAIVPYGSKAQFQIMYKGFIQLAIRSGDYAKMNVTEIYADEIREYNPITGEIDFNDFSECTLRDEGKESSIVGVYAWFKLTSGFDKALYMSRKEIENHARKYSKAYGYDISQKKKASLWSTDWTTMAKKTVLKLLLSKWGILSIEMQTAITEDQKVDEGYLDNPNYKIVETPASSLDAKESEAKDENAKEGE